jgi:predicted RNase H-like nuclease
MNYAVLDGGLRRQQMGAGTLDDVRAAILTYPAAVVAVDAPQSPNGGRMRDPDVRQSFGLPRGTPTWSGYKVCEFELRRRGIGLYSTPDDPAAAPRWMQMGFRLYQALGQAGFVIAPPAAEAEPAPRQMLEVHPHASYTVLLGHLPLPKASLEGRLQRQLVLYREGVDVLDPMEVLEELTPHRLLDATFELPGLLDHDSLDALAAAFTAYKAATQPDCVTRVGDPVEGQIVLPIPPSDLQERYRH